MVGGNVRAFGVVYKRQFAIRPALRVSFLNRLCGVGNRNDYAANGFFLIGPMQFGRTFC